MGFQIRYITKQKTKVNNHYKIIHFKKTFDALIKNKTITSLGRYKSSFYINKRKLFFKEEVDRMYYELLGNSIAEYLNINYTYYEPTIIKTATREIKGLVAKDYRREGYSLVKFNKLLNGKEMTLDNIKIALDIYFNDYINKEELVNKIYSEVIKHYMLDLLIGNNDNGEYNYEMMVSKDNAYLSPYSDFGLTFNFTSTRLRVNEEVDNSIYSNLKVLLKEDKYYQEFINMYNKLNPFILEELIEELEQKRKIALDDNFKNIIFLSYSKHYMLVRNILEMLRNKNKIKQIER